MTANVTENASTVPVEVTYRVNGQQRTERTELPIEADDGDDDGGALGGLSPLAVGAGIGLSALVGAAVLVPLSRRRLRR